MATDDDEPFKQGSALGADLARVAGGQLAGQGMDAEAQRAFRLRVRQWAEARGFVVRDSELVARVEEIEIVVRMFEMTEETAVVRATAQVPAALSFRFEPARKSWTDALRRKLGGKRPAVEPDFDARFDLRTDDEHGTRQLLDESVRDAVSEIDAWCRVVYEQGKIEIRLDHALLAGRHLLAATALAVALARARLSTSAYR